MARRTAVKTDIIAVLSLVNNIIPTPECNALNTCVKLYLNK